MTDEQPGRVHANKGDLGHVPKKDAEFPNLERMRAFDRQMHIEKAMEMGMTREEAERHADHDLADREESRP